VSCYTPNITKQIFFALILFELKGVTPLGLVDCFAFYLRVISALRGWVLPNMII
jgi:hypothetical protein